MLHLLLLCLTAWMPSALPTAEPQDPSELVAEFRRYYTKDRTPDERREAVLTLKGIEGLSAAEVLLTPLEDEEFLVRRAAVEVLAAMRSEPVAHWLVEEVLADRKQRKRELLVAGVGEALGGMGHAFVRPTLEELVGDRRLDVRLGAIAGLGALGDKGAVPALAALMGDAASSVVVASLAALARLDPGEQASEALLAGLAHPDKQVRLAAVRAALPMRLKSSLRPLMVMLDNDPDPRLSEDAYEVLLTLSQRSFPDETAAWLTWWDRAEDRFSMPDQEALAAARKKIAEEGGRYSKGRKSFQGIETKSENIVFVIDVSKSMEEPFSDPERLAATGRQYGSLQRLGIVKEELINTIDSLQDTTLFNIISFASDVDSWKKRPVRASILNRNNAKSWVAGLEPKGGGGAGFRARLGLAADAANEGQTNTHLALMKAFGEEPDAKSKNAFVTSSNDPVDTIFFLTDGEPTVGETVDMVEIREEVRRVNAYRNVQLHVIYVGAYGGKDFRLLAEENNGVFVAVGG